MKNHLILGNWNALCDSCGRKFKANMLRKRWDGLMVCEEDWEQRHPQDLLRVQREQISVPWSRPYPAQDTFIPENLWTNPADSLGLDETYVKSFIKNILDPLNSSGALNGVAFNATVFNENGADFSRPETFLITETFLAALARNLTDTVAISETVTKTFGRSFQDTISVAESLWFSETEHNTESLSLSELKAFVVNKTITDSLSITESTSLSFSSNTALNGAALGSIALG